MKTSIVVLVLIMASACGGSGVGVEQKAEGYYRGNAFRTSGDKHSLYCPEYFKPELEFRNSEPVFHTNYPLTGASNTVTGSGFKFSTTSTGCMGADGICRTISLAYDLTVDESDTLVGTVQLTLSASGTASEVCSASYSTELFKQ